MSVSIKEEEEEVEAERGTGTSANVPLLQEEDGPAKAKEIQEVKSLLRSGSDNEDVCKGGDPINNDETTSSMGSGMEQRRRAFTGTSLQLLTPTLVLSVLAAVVGSSTQFGYNTGVINSPKEAILDSFNNQTTTNSSSSAHFSDFEMNVAVSIYAVGGMLGALVAGLLADAIGRKWGLLLNNSTAVVGMLLESLAVHPTMFIVGRFVIGVNSGVNTVLVPMYVSEISPVKLRGALGVLHQLSITLTILSSQVLGLNQLLGRTDFYGWRILFSVPFIFTAFQLLVFPWCPQSPRFLFIKKRKEEKAVRALHSLRGPKANISKELSAIESEYSEELKRTKTIRFVDFITTPSLRRPLILGILLHLSQQLSGIVGVFYYSTQVFQTAGVGNADVPTVAVGIILVIFTLITVFLIDVWGRRTLLLHGLGGMGVFFILLTIMFCFQDAFYGDTSQVKVTVPGVLLVVCSLGVVALFALGPGAIPWLMVSELFLQEARPFAVAVSTVVNWGANFVVAISFPYILKFLYPYGLLLFALICGILWLPLYLFLPETKGRTVEQTTQGFLAGKILKN